MNKNQANFFPPTVLPLAHGVRLAFNDHDLLPCTKVSVSSKLTNRVIHHHHRQRRQRRRRGPCGSAPGVFKPSSVVLALSRPVSVGPESSPRAPDPLLVLNFLEVLSACVSVSPGVSLFCQPIDFGVWAERKRGQGGRGEGGGGGGEGVRPIGLPKFSSHSSEALLNQFRWNVHSSLSGKT